jgi:hypothetical protein
MSAWAKPGVKRVCVDASYIRGDMPLRVGGVYEIVRVGRPCGDGRGRYRRPQLVVALAETANPFSPDGSFAVERFRPLVTKTQEQDVALFRHLLAPKNVEEPV